jgi:SPP1 gp7 family putative phage head morphogenesis protein
MMDYGHEWTDKELKKLEARIAREYKQAAKETAAKLEEYYKRHEAKKKIKLKELADGKIDEKEYKRWLIGQLAIGQRWQDMVDTLAEDYRNTNRIVYSMTRKFTYEAYALNHNYGTFEAEKGSHIDTSYTLYDRQTVERLIRDDPQLLPPPGRRVSQKIAEGSAVLWNKQVIQSLMTQSILQGESIGKIADRVQHDLSPSFTIEDIRNQDRKTAKQIANELAKKNRDAAIRNARTMTTGAENAGRVDSYKRAESMGIKLQQEWIATLDNRTRHEHRLLDGQKVAVGDEFKVDDYTIRFPGDPQAAPEMIYNCRCTVIGVVAGTQMDKLKAKDLPRNSKLGDMTYEEWEKGHISLNLSIISATKRISHDKAFALLQAGYPIYDFSKKDSEEQER